jgi:hypothetical protein
MDLIKFLYLMRTPLLAHANCLGLILPKHGVIFPQYAFSNFCAKNCMAYI